MSCSCPHIYLHIRFLKLANALIWFSVLLRVKNIVLYSSLKCHIRKLIPPKVIIFGGFSFLQFASINHFIPSVYQWLRGEHFLWLVKSGGINPREEQDIYNWIYNRKCEGICVLVNKWWNIQILYRKMMCSTWKMYPTPPPQRNCGIVYVYN